MKVKKTLFHVYLFLWGWLYYLVFPLIIVILGMFYKYPGIKNVYENYNEDIICKYCIYIVLFLISYIIGCLSPLKFRKKRKDKIRKDLVIGTRDLLIFFILPLFLLGQYKIIMNRSILFKGYQIEYDTGLMGTIATINVVFIFFSIYNILKKRSSKRLTGFLILGIIEFSVILLGLGSRLYVLIPIIIYLLYGIDTKKISFKRVFYIGIIFTTFFLAVGLWRLGNTLKVDMMMYIGAAESMFTWISAETYFNNELPLFAFPAHFLSSFINFIPSVILPNKADLILPMEANFYTPFGALNIIVSLIYNFGVIGSLFIVYCFGLILTYIRVNCKSILYKSYYFCICGIIPFQFFRDDLHIITKMIFYNFLLLPIIFILIEKFLCYNFQKSHTTLQENFKKNNYD